MVQTVLHPISSVHKNSITAERTMQEQRLLDWLHAHPHQLVRQLAPKYDKRLATPIQWCGDTLQAAFLIANNPDSTAHALEWLLTVDCKSLLERIATNPATPSAILARLASHDDEEVRAAVAENENLPIELLEMIAADSSPNVRYALAEGYHVPFRLLEELSADTNPCVATRASKTMTKLMETSHPKIRVVIVDDDAFVRSYLQMKLSAYNDISIVGEAVDGESAIELATELKPDVVLMDIGLPGMTGITSTNKIKSVTPATRVLMVTSRDSSEDIFSAFENGAEGYYLKTNSNKALIDAIRTVYKREAYIDPGIASTVLRRCLYNLDHDRLSPPKESSAISLLLSRVDHYIEHDQLEDAITLAEATVVLSEANKLQNPTGHAAALARLADLYYMEEEYKKAEPIYQSVLELRQRILDFDEVMFDDNVFHLAEFYLSQKNYEQAELYYSWSLRIRETLGNESMLEEVRERLHYVLEQQGKRDVCNGETTH